ncbi:hypothetical protein WN944_011190 [Citrus x changshan-huyou]|uniref:Uncharacterized protein n=1 Tax=Citrus x changshan-huyou TaxID=2935761 RepID=A0AAP0MXT7_9ROSI
MEQPSKAACQAESANEKRLCQRAMSDSGSGFLMLSPKPCPDMCGFEIVMPKSTFLVYETRIGLAESGLGGVSVEASASLGGGSHESSEQGLRSSIHEQERDEIEHWQEWISSFFEVSLEAPVSPEGDSYESTEQGLRSSIHKQERDEIEFDER